MNSIHLQQTLPQVFADRNSVTSDVWHQDLIFRKEEMYLICLLYTSDAADD